MSDDPTSVRRWSHLLFRAGATVAAGLAAAQPVMAGGFLQGHYSMLAIHSATGSVLAAALVVALPGGVLLWRPGRGPGSPAALCAVALVVCGVQIGVGYTRELIIHVPLGVVLLGLVVKIAVLSWQMPLAQRKAADNGRSADGAVTA